MKNTSKALFLSVTVGFFSEATGVQAAASLVDEFSQLAKSGRACYNAFQEGSGDLDACLEIGVEAGTYILNAILEGSKVTEEFQCHGLNIETEVKNPWRTAAMTAGGALVGVGAVLVAAPLVPLAGFWGLFGYTAFNAAGAATGAALGAGAGLVASHRHRSSSGIGWECSKDAAGSGNIRVRFTLPGGGKANFLCTTEQCFVDPNPRHGDL